MDKKKFVPRNLANVVYLSELTANPQGQIAYVETLGHEESGQFSSRILLPGSSPDSIGSLDESSFQTKSPKFSPCGRYLAYLSNQTGEFQVYIHTFDGGTVTQVTTLRHGITYFSWSQDSRELVFTGPLWQEERESGIWNQEMTVEEKSAWLYQKEWEPVEIQEIDYKNDDCYGIRDGSHLSIGIVQWQSGQQLLIRTGKMSCSYPVFSRDGQALSFYGNPYGGPRGSFPELFISERRDGFLRIQQVTREESLNLMADCPAYFTKDRSHLYVPVFVAYEDDRSSQSIYRLRVEDGSYEDLMLGKNRITEGVFGEPVSRTIYGEKMPYYQVDQEEQYLYFTNAWNGWENLYQMDLNSGNSIIPVIENRINVHGFLLPHKGVFSILGGDCTTITEYFTWDVQTQELDRKTHSNEWIQEYELGEVEHLLTRTKDGTHPLHVWVVHPVGEIPGKKYPAVLDIHGGPECSYVSDFWHEFQALAAAGIYCVYTNPRGSYGHGAEFARGNYSWGVEAQEDLHRALDAAIESCQIDPQRVGVTGGSYGGYMTNKLIIESDRFRGAVSQRCLVNTATSYGTGDIGFISRREKNLSNIKMLEFLTRRARGTLLRKVDQIKTPLLLLHGYRDYRCSFEQSEQLLIAMKERNPQVPVRLVMFPEENHGITRTGKLYNQIRHLQELVDWFVEYLKEDENGEYTQ